MELSENEKQIMISILRTLIYNTVDELKVKLISAKETLSSEKYNLMMFGDDDLFEPDADVKYKEKYKRINVLEGRWCLQSQLFYHLTKTKKIKEDEHNELLKI
jgi:hypothetical protein